MGAALLSPVTIWKPNEGPQYKFVGSIEREVLYGGAAGGGKSDGLLLSAAHEVNNRAHRAIIFRRSYPELKDLIRRSEEVYPYLGGRYRSSSREWIFKSGAIIEFGYIERAAEKQKYKRAWNFIGWDELTHWPTDEVYVFLLGRLRAVVGSNLTLRVRATTNPGGPGHEWVRARFNVPDEGSYSEIYDAITDTWRLFIPAKVRDNPFLAGTSYERDLDALPEDTRRMLKDGRWDIVAGAMFSEFDHRIHVCDSFPIGADWEMWRGADDGYNMPACILWATRYEGRTYIIDELYRNKMTPELMAEEVKKKDFEIPVFDETDSPSTNSRKLRGDIDSSAFNEIGVGNALGTGRGQIMNTLGCNWQPAQKGPGSRVAGVNLIHGYLRKKLPDGKPKLVIFRKCKNLIRTLPTLPKDETNPEDVDTEAEDHPYDALRYLLQYKPNVITQRKLSGM